MVARSSFEGCDGGINGFIYLPRVIVKVFRNRTSHDIMKHGDNLISLFAVQMFKQIFIPKYRRRSHPNTPRGP